MRYTVKYQNVGSRCNEGFNGQEVGDALARGVFSDFLCEVGVIESTKYSKGGDTQKT